MTDTTQAPERIFLQDAGDYAATAEFEVTWCVDAQDENDTEYVRADLFAAAEARARESALDALAAYGQAADAHEAQLAAEARVAELEAMLSRAWEMGRDDAAGAAEKRYDQCERVLGQCQLRKCAIARFLRALPVPSPADLADRVKGGGV